MTAKTACRILGLYAETALHAGTGQSLGVIDLPIQREKHTGWPCIYGSGLKGPLRNWAQGKGWCDTVFGPEFQGKKDTDAETSESKDSEFYAGALSVGDARLLLLPVRSLTSHFKWVTCPAVLRRMKVDYKRMGIEILKTFDESIFANLDKATALVNKAESQSLYLEELRFKTKAVDLTVLIETIKPLIHEMQEQLAVQLTIVHDDIFQYLTQYATPVVPHISIESETKTAKAGALWYEESLPPDTVLYSTLIMMRGRNRKDANVCESAQDLMTKLVELMQAGYLQVGGNETTGMGWCYVSLQGAE